MPAHFEKPSGYLSRVVDAQVERYLKIFGAVEIAGTKWCGKTWTALEHAESVTYVEESEELARADSSMVLIGSRPHVVDEWQRVPAIWDAVRREVDRTRGMRGAFILTGSSTPIGGAGSPAHSGAGRIGSIRMHPMSLFESGDSTGAVSFSSLFEGVFSPCVAEKDTVGLVDVACRGGWPESVGLAAIDAQLIAREYLDATFKRSVSRLGLDPDIARRVVASIARNLGQATTYKTIIADMFAAEEQPHTLMDVEKVRMYLNALKDMYLIEEVPGWAPPARSRKRFATKPKRYLADPSLAAAILGMGTEALVDDWQTFGLVFENMAMRDLAVYARSLELLDGVPIRYYRDDSGLEVDAVVQLADGNWAAIEIKTSEDKVEEGLRSLRRMRAKLTGNPLAQTKEPAFMAVITGNGQYAREAEPGIYVIPLRTLRP